MLLGSGNDVPFSDSRTKNRDCDWERGAGNREQGIRSNEQGTEAERLTRNRKHSHVCQSIFGNLAAFSAFRVVHKYKLTCAALQTSTC